jgi:hypothetical protein
MSSHAFECQEKSFETYVNNMDIHLISAFDYEQRKTELFPKLKSLLGEKYQNTLCLNCHQTYFNPTCESSFHKLPIEWLAVWAEKSEPNIAHKKLVLKAFDRQILHFMIPENFLSGQTVADYEFACRYYDIGVCSYDPFIRHMSFREGDAQFIDYEREQYFNGILTGQNVTLSHEMLEPVKLDLNPKRLFIICDEFGTYISDEEDEDDENQYEYEEAEYA